jgi:hypothetical protein
MGIYLTAYGKQNKAPLQVQLRQPKSYDLKFAPEGANFKWEKGRKFWVPVVVRFLRVDKPKDSNRKEAPRR